MKNPVIRRMSRLLPCAAMTAALCVSIGFAPRASGQTILIGTPQQLYDVRNDLDADYIQVADINLANFGMTPIGTAIDKFIGSYDGNGYKITNFSYAGRATEDQVGLFGYAEGADLANITLENAHVSGRDDVGCLVGFIHGGAITSCIVRNSTGAIDRSFAAGSMSVGGLIGRTHATTVTSCVSFADSDASERWSGSMIGHIHTGSTVTNSHAHGDATGNKAVGGFSGNIHGSLVEECTADGDVEAISVCGGFTGYFHQDASQNPQLSIARDCSASGDVISTDADFLSFIDGDGANLFIMPSTGGFVGWLEPESVVDNCAAAGDAISPLNQYYQTASGGMIGFATDDCLVTQCTAYQAVIVGDSAGGIVGWAQNGTLVEDCTAYSDCSGVWQIGGLVGAAEEITIQRCTAYGDVDASGIAGNRHAETGKLNAAAGGLVGYSYPGTAAFATKISCCAAHGDVTGDGQFVGGLVGFLWGTELRQSFSTGSVTSDDRRLGGLIGGVNLEDDDPESTGRSAIIDCYASGTVTQATTDPDYQGWAGGLIGYMEGASVAINSVTNCYSVGFVAAIGQDVGGLIGKRDVNTTVTSSYWDTQTSGQSGSAGGIGKTTQEMKQQATFVGWNFNTPAIWDIDEGVTYPFLLCVP